MALLRPLPVAGINVRIPIGTPQRLQTVNPAQSPRLHVLCAAFSAGQPGNKVLFSELSWLLALMEQGHWANRSSRPLGSLGAMRKICGGLTRQQQQHATPQRPPVVAGQRVSRLWRGGTKGGGLIFFLFLLNDRNSYACRLANARGFTRAVSIFH